MALVSLHPESTWYLNLPQAGLHPFLPQVDKAPTAPGAQGDLSCHGTLAVGRLFVNTVLLSPFVPAEAK